MAGLTDGRATEGWREKPKRESRNVRHDMKAYFEDSEDVKLSKKKRRIGKKAATEGSPETYYEIPNINKDAGTPSCQKKKSQCNARFAVGIAIAQIPNIEISKDEEVRYTWRIVRYLYPWLKVFNDEQSAEKEMEAKVKGFDASELEIPKANCRKEERIYCNNCNTSIADIHRTCPDCNYDLSHLLS
ncbi:putative jumonji-like transcription factor family protein [Carex littledalei]|uniref:Putative jumonji-like transcription factor family protein n=1 Tax=Carex littledalei TaxID=544730 RepID=A0A833RA45_9POAL|nr:putative jumonji-like transcription factor family protein [Carex littledalei]